ncbi:cysteine protease ATG4 [Plasmodium gonderi]|uniref:Cysteine protease ATG4 n=1 Tax=Plasmodium gonderi TaxID=77519 RepID=A0A1Y1JRE7_PLAGO|nr:cysteine protease ATG4 [Plasmodium gonderi]GAW83043.1 cysteine protease ATG4 [Plasmodium gonderi]
MEKSTNSLQHGENVICENCSKTNVNHNRDSTFNEMVLNEKDKNINYFNKANNVLKKKKKRNQRKCKKNSINTTKKDSEVYCHQNKSKYKLINYFNSIKYNLSIKRYFKMLISVSIFNYFPLNFRNISNNAYMCGKRFNLKDSESFKLFLILCKSKVLFTYRSNFLLKNSNRSSFDSNSTVTTTKNEDVLNMASYTTQVNTVTSTTTIGTTATTTATPNENTQNNDTLCNPKDEAFNCNMNSYGTQFNNTRKAIEQMLDLQNGKYKRRKKKRKKKKYYKERVINFTDIPEHFLKKIYFDEMEYFYMNFESVSKSNHHGSYFKRNNYKYTNNHSFCGKNDLNNAFSEDENNRDTYLYSTNDSNKTVLYVENSGSNSDFNKGNVKTNGDSCISDDETVKCTNLDTCTINDKLHLDKQQEDINISMEKEFPKSSTSVDSKMLTNNEISVECNMTYRKTDKKWENKKLKSSHLKKGKNTLLHNQIMKNKYMKYRRRKKTKFITEDNNTTYTCMNDVGWGCMIRVVQMVLANIFVKYKISKKYAFFHNINDYVMFKNYMNKSLNEQYENKEEDPTIIKDEVNKSTSNENRNVEKMVTQNWTHKNCSNEDMKESNFFITNIKSGLSHCYDKNSTMSNNSNCVPANNFEIYTRTKMENTKEEETMNESQCMHLYSSEGIQKIHFKKEQNLCHYFKNYENFLNMSEDNILSMKIDKVEHMKINNSLIYYVLLQFRDMENAKYSIQNIIYETMKYKKINKKNMENFLYEWLGPTSSAIIISNLINRKKVRFLKKRKNKIPLNHRKFIKVTDEIINKNDSVEKKKNEQPDNTVINNTDSWFVKRKKRHAFFSVAFDSGIIYNNEVLKFFQIKQKIFVIIWICLKLGTDSINISKYKQSVLSCFGLKQFQGISSGNAHTSAYYFYAANENGLFYLDPHVKCQKAFTDLNQNHDFEFFTEKINFLPWEYLNSSLSMIYVVESKEDYFNLTHNLKLIDPSIFEVYDEEPQYTFRSELNFDTDDSGLILL